jgi:hypothetical protein
MKDTPAPIAYPQKAEPCTAHTVLLQMATQSKSSGHAPALAQQITNGIKAFFLEIFFLQRHVLLIVLSSCLSCPHRYEVSYSCPSPAKFFMHVCRLLSPASVISNKISTGELELFFR